ncbi:MAG: DUF1559 domain-containing protein [Planctomycetaceae bacterium]|jgi:hypothetical protein|nr:DUF1559 domain-containing protein [Planctomycetaceae bacterium]
MFYRFRICFVLLSVITLCGYGQGYAQKTPEQLAEEIAPLVSENTIVVAHIDSATFSLKDFYGSIKTNSQMLLDAVASIPEMNATMKSAIDSYCPSQEFIQQIDTIFPVAEKEFQEHYKMTGIRDFYYLAMLDGTPISDFLVVPLRSGINKEFLESQNFTEINGFMILYGKAFRRTLQQGTSQEMVRFAFQTGFVKTHRPEIAKAFALAGNKPIKAVAFFPAYTKTLFTQITPTLPEPLNKIPVAQITDGLRYAAAGFDFNTFRGEITICSKDQASAEQFRNIVLSFSDVIKEFQKMKELQKNNTDELIISMRWGEFIGSLIKQNSDFLFPPPNDGKMIIRYQSTDSADDMKKLLVSINNIVKHLRTDQMVQQENCVKNIRNIILAMHNYYDRNKSLPPAYTLNKDGKPLQSWRVLLLPYLEHAALYEQIRLDEAWDSEWNKQFHNQCPVVFQCSTMTDEEKKSGGTSYSLVIGKQTYPVPGKRKFLFSDVTDGTSNTIAVIERKTPVNWMQPDAELTENAVFRGVTDSASGVGLRHQKGEDNGFNTGWLDGSVRFIEEKIPLEKWKAFLTISGGEVVF